MNASVPDAAALKEFREAVDDLRSAAQAFATGELSPVAYRDRREPALVRAVVLMARLHDVALQTPLHVDSLGELRVIALHPEGPILTRGCGKFGAAFAQALTRHGARTGVAPTALCADNGWCNLHHLQAEKMVMSFADQA